MDAAATCRPAFELLADAAKVTPASPGYVSIQYYRLVGLRQAGRLDKARQVADMLLQRTGLDLSARNLILSQRAGLDTTLGRFFQDGAGPIIQVVLPGSENGYVVTPADMRTSKFLNWRPELKQPHPSYFTLEAATIMNQAMLYRMFYDTLDLPLAPNLKQSVAIAAWTRGYLYCGRCASCVAIIRIRRICSSANAAGRWHGAIGADGDKEKAASCDLPSSCNRLLVG